MHIRAAAQGFIAFVTLGARDVRQFLYVAGWIVDMYALSGAQPPHNWTSILLWPAAMSALVLFLFFAAFKPQEEAAK